MDGLLVIDKHSGPTSFEVVRQVRALTGASKAGHTGTLDPMATGVLPVALGEATKLAGLLTDSDKAYDAVVRLGLETDTLDVTGTVLRTSVVPPLSEARIEAALAPFRGSFLQTPPMVSAVKVRGRRLYQLARAGQEVERTPRPVTVHALVLRDFSATDVTLSVRCSKGFFVRVLAEELGRTLGCGGCLKGLRRTGSGTFTLEGALSLERLEALVQGPQGLLAVRVRLVSPADMLPQLAIFRVSAEEAAKVAHGLPLPAHLESRGRVRVLGPDGALLAVADVRDGRLAYVRVLAHA
ncbi:MAG: tRNA pseudouridine(55) synthase TruB [Myxococcaceae bacterium]